ncbi:mycofactocin system transcriptional regulator [Nocardia spumae]|uniref:mycofactocin system transcriptional regulator n=1 Tax=Nocardia spumae TaxID=2887190 RepID=UPI001D159343|nr:mycofactocin system transcriptional regulator [Nocardia spumae]
MEGARAGKVAGARGRAGRKPSTSAVELERAAFELFEQRGFDDTTVEDIAAAVGVSKRTFFRYFDSKNDVVWGSFTDQLHAMRELFDRCPPEQGIADAVRTVVVAFNRFDPAQVPWHRKRMELILKVPALQAHSTLRYREWRNVVAEFVAGRMGVDTRDLLPQVAGYCALGVAVAGYEHWLGHPDEELTDVLDRALRGWSSGFGG